MIIPDRPYYGPVRRLLMLWLLSRHKPRENPPQSAANSGEPPQESTENPQ